ncbi:MAG: glycerol-3-phosphate dehydrogenase [Acidibrevibacterium sp.]|jgi:glycerol-3-phosphate dehydrogenase|uniref:glycerol-3-phosphate dehydrogenase n=1 Tax=Acidibrevibacterium fodinaquatile TaxID=1969806 RepID=UPI0023A807F5|nr:glycerol-3-phosphate dehydrogenase [Acidibrevibacterium fodinaquatile]MCA7119057.1 glycerol-3-phosphate dehydrogenase [Acidibrevibacterium fodinaquatile]
MSAPSYDLAIIGGGVNGCGIARDAAGRGLSVYLCEQGDLASGTSSWSTKLVHGGLRYLEYYEFRLVREALIEREVLWRAAPHIIAPLRFVLPHHAGLRPAWLLRLGLFLYDHLGGRRLLPPTRVLDLDRDAAGAPLKPGLFHRGFEYSDCRVDDSRLVVLNARDAADRGAVIETRTQAIGAERGRDGWRLAVRGPGAAGATRTIHARALINAAGPWVADVLADTLRTTAQAKARLVQGSHIVVRRLYDHDRCYIFQNGDGRVIFAIPYERDFTLIGTTDRDYHGDPAQARATSDEIAYLCAATNDYFAQAITPDDVVWAFSGVRALYDDGASEAKAATRDYVLDLDASVATAPLLSVFGGKITTYRRLAEAALKKLAPHLGPCGAPWTAGTPLPGGDFPVAGRAELARNLAARYDFLDARAAERLVSTYGVLATRVLGEARSRADLGRGFGADLSEAEVGYLMAREWARNAEDILWRRTKLGLRMSAAEAAELDAFMAQTRPREAQRGNAR